MLLYSVGLHAQSTSQPSRGVTGTDHAVFDQILRRHVRDHRVDYARLKALDGEALQDYRTAMAQADVAALARAEQLAFYINVYNASMIAAVLEQTAPQWTPAVDQYRVFDRKFIALREAKSPFSLNQLEHEIIRKRFAEPRIHVALVCGAISCPPIAPRAHTAANLEGLLESAMIRFVNDSRRNPVDISKKVLRLSKIFEWYRDDFGGAAALPAYIAKYHRSGLDMTGWMIEHVDYDWSLNRAAPLQDPASFSLAQAQRFEIDPAHSSVALVCKGKQDLRATSKELRGEWTITFGAKPAASGKLALLGDSWTTNAPEQDAEFRAAWTAPRWPEVEFELQGLRSIEEVQGKTRGEASGNLRIRGKSYAVSLPVVWRLGESQDLQVSGNVVVHWPADLPSWSERGASSEVSISLDLTARWLGPASGR